MDESDRDVWVILLRKKTELVINLSIDDTVFRDYFEIKRNLESTCIHIGHESRSRERITKTGLFVNIQAEGGGTTVVFLYISFSILQICC